MRLVTNLEEIKQNTEVLDTYIDGKKDPEYSWAIERVKKGVCFLAMKKNGYYRFYPSRFIGYADNTMDKHDQNEYKDGRETNPAISSILGQKYEVNNRLDNEYRSYCESLGFTPGERGAFGAERKYWEI